MRITARFATTGILALGLFGFGAGAALADGDDAHQACVEQQQQQGVLPLNLDLLNQCIADYND